MEQNSEQNIFAEWGIWHFYEMPKFLLEVWKNYILFALNYFSLLTLVKTFFAPWRKYRWVYPKGFDFVEFLWVEQQKIYDSGNDSEICSPAACYKYCEKEKCQRRNVKYF